MITRLLTAPHVAYDRMREPWRFLVAMTLIMPVTILDRYPLIIVPYLLILVITRMLHFHV